jgi:hypothetical protein
MNDMGRLELIKDGLGGFTITEVTVFAGEKDPLFVFFGVGFDKVPDCGSYEA